MSLTSKDVRHIARLARLEVNEDQCDGLVGDLSRILEFVDQLQAAPVQQVEPMAHPLAMTQRLRPDVVTESDQRELFQRNAPACADGLYLVPRVID